MSETVRIPIGQGARPAFIAGRYANRHGLIAGATGTGKTYTLATLAEGFSQSGVPVFLSDVKGDLAGLALPGRSQPPPVQFLDVFGEQGAPVRAPVRRFGADLLARVLELSPTQSKVLGALFATTSARLDTLTDLAAILPGAISRHVGSSRHGHLDTSGAGLAGPATIGAIQRALVRFRQTGADSLFGAPAFNVASLERAPGLVSILAADRLIRQPDLYAAFLLYLLRELYERAPELGDVEAPRLVLVFDEAHLMFRDAPPALVRSVEQTVRLIRSKGIGVYFASQAPADIPPSVAAQLGNRVQHAMRAATLADRREIRGAAESLAINPRIDAAEAIASMPTGTALVSTLQGDGAPTPVDIVRINPPRARLGPLTADERRPFIPPATAVCVASEAPAAAEPAPAKPAGRRFPRWKLRFWLAIAALIAAGLNAPAWLVLAGLAAAVTVPLPRRA